MAIELTIPYTRPIPFARFAADTTTFLRTLVGLPTLPPLIVWSAPGFQSTKPPPEALGPDDLGLWLALAGTHATFELLFSKSDDDPRFWLDVSSWRTPESLALMLAAAVALARLADAPVSDHGQWFTDHFELPADRFLRLASTDKRQDELHRAAEALRVHDLTLE